MTSLWHGTEASTGIRVQYRYYTISTIGVLRNLKVIPGALVGMRHRAKLKERASA